MIGALSFLGSAAGRIIIAAGVALLLLSGAYLKGHSDGAVRANAACQKATAAAYAKGVAAGSASAEADRERAAAAEKAAAESEAIIDALQEQLRLQPASESCKVRKEDAQTLNRIR